MLHFAAKGQQAKTVHYLLLRGIKPTIQNKFDETPLFSAAESGNIDVVNRLLKEKDCKIDHQDKFGDTALHFAARDGQAEVCEYLIKKFRKLVKVKNQEGKTAMNYAIENSQPTCLQVIKSFDGEATYADRNAKIKELATKMMHEFPDYKKSVFKHETQKITIFGKRITRAELISE